MSNGCEHFYVYRLEPQFKDGEPTKYHNQGACKNCTEHVDLKEYHFVEIENGKSLYRRKDLGGRRCKEWLK